MAIIFTIAGTVFGLISTIFFSYKSNQFGLPFGIFAIVLYLYALFVYIKELKAKKEPNSLSGLKVESYSTNENDKLVIKAIGTSDGFINFNEIVSDTNLNTKPIKKILDWLVVNKFATCNKGCKDNVYELTPKGRNIFGHIISPDIQT